MMNNHGVGIGGTGLRVQGNFFFWRLIFLALLCATTQQSYCRHAGVRRS